MAFKTELNAISKQYVKLIKLPVNDMLPALTEVLHVISCNSQWPLWLGIIMILLYNCYMITI